MESIEEPERQRLHRRDTPHHLKNKRIHQGGVDKEKVASIIAQALRKQEDSSSGGEQSSINSQTFQQQQFNNTTSLTSELGDSLSGPNSATGI